MNQKLFYFLSILVTIILTTIVCFFIARFHEIQIINKTISEVKETAYKIGQSKTKNDCDFEYIVYFYENLFNDRNGSGVNAYSKIKKNNSQKELNTFISNVEKNFSEQTEFIELFKYNKKELEKLSEKNIDIINFKPTDYNRESPLVKSWKNSTIQYFYDAQLIYLKSVLNAYCESSQDTNGCVKMVFNK